MNKHPADVTVIGAGLIGLTQALLLAIHYPQLHIAVLESATKLPQASVDGYDARVVALTKASQTLLEEVGVWEQLPEFRKCSYTQMVVWDAEGTGSVHFNCRDVKRPNLGYILENNAIISALRTRMESLPNIELTTGFDLDKGWYKDAIWYLRPQIDSASSADSLPVHTTRLLIGADGIHSKVRDLLGIRTRDTDYQQAAIVCTVRCQKSHQHTAWQRFLDTGPLAFLPLAGTEDHHHCAIVWSADETLAGELANLNDAEFSLRLEQAFESKLGRIESVSRRHAFPLQARHAETYWAANGVIIGDAAHNIHPLAGQGANLGLMDARVLDDEIGRALRRGLAPGHDSTLSRYQRRRRGENAITLNAMSGFKTLFGAKALHWRWLRNSGFNLVDTSPLLKKHIIMRAMAI